MPNPKGDRPHLAASRERLELEAHVGSVQDSIRSCRDCGLCCTKAHNSAQILPIEALRIAQHLLDLPEARRQELVSRLQATTQENGLKMGGPAVPYTCSFLNSDATCALPRSIKPTLCLSFNPLDEDTCDQEPDWFFPTHDVDVIRNLRASLPKVQSSIPPAVLAALDDLRSVSRERKPTRAGNRSRPNSPRRNTRRDPPRRK
ncbi:MAG TPA: hypothetical protein PKA37_05385 [Planctomycetota bacterium]|nr:hypothetical protein [Planctomycetota bacterium]